SRRVGIGLGGGWCEEGETDVQDQNPCGVVFLLGVPEVSIRGLPRQQSVPEYRSRTEGRSSKGNDHHGHWGSAGRISPLSLDGKHVRWRRLLGLSRKRATRRRLSSCGRSLEGRKNPQLLLPVSDSVLLFKCVLLLVFVVGSCDGRKRLFEGR
ncbi:unnamed protein product, partial [Ascophyllum nodosum]